MLTNILVGCGVVAVALLIGMVGEAVSQRLAGGHRDDD